MKKFGIIGMSEGNAHPYSWSSIINGVYDGNEIKKVGYPAVAAYLKANEDTLGILNAEVTHIWTQDTRMSDSIAGSSGIAHVMQRAEDMIGEVDAVILARDDAENHVTMSRAFIEAGLPVFIDKPLATNQEDLHWFTEQERSGKLIMSCSSMRYANECRIVKQEMDKLGPLELVTAVGKKDWLKYGVHMLEAIIASLDDPQAHSVQHIGDSDQNIVHIVFENGLRATIHLFKDITPTFQVSYFGREAWRMADIKNSYSMFRDNIIEFARSVEEGKSRLPFSKTVNIINCLVAAQASHDAGGTTIYLK